MDSVVRVRDVMELPQLAGSRVVAGAEGLHREVRSVTVAEIPDISRWLSGHDFVHSVGQGFVTEAGDVDEDRLVAWARELMDAGVACIAIKTKRFIPEIPDALLALGDLRQVPIVELGPDVFQGTLNGAIYELIMESRRSNDRQRQDSFVRLVRDITGPHGLSHTATRMSVYLDAPVIISDAQFGFLGCSNHNASQVLRAAHLRAMRDAVEQAEEPTQIAGYQDLGGTLFLAPPLDEDLSGHRLLVERVVHRGTVLGHVGALVDTLTLNAQWMMLFLTLSEVLAADMGRYANTQTSVQKARNELLAALMRSEPDEKRVAHLADLLGLNLLQPIRVIMIVAQGDLPGFTSEAEGDDVISQALERANDYLQSALGSTAELLIGGWERGIGLIFFGDPYPPQRLQVVVEGLVESLRDGRVPNRRLVAGIGMRWEGLSGLHQSARNAFDAVRCVEGFQLQTPVASYERLGAFPFLEQALVSRDATEDYVEVVLGPVLDQSEGEAEELMETLSAYLEANGSFSAAARQMYVHANTVRYRISKLQELLSVDLSTADGRGAVWLALRLHTFFTNTKQGQV